MAESSSKPADLTKPKSARKPTGRGRMPVQVALPKVLRIGIIQGGKIIEERIVRRRETVTFGPSEKNTFVLPASDIPVGRY